ncbi:MAG: hypothetical protein LBN29_01270 [Mediterranea sp.]|jgi:hypothetical protein|nr:hypothetical protein [Mediterranea sp.]
MVLGFQPRFKEPILADIKIHSLRADMHGRWKAGRSIQFATGVRTSRYECFKEGICVSTQEVKIHISGKKSKRYVEVYVDGRPFDSEELETLARKDGFKSTKDFLDFFDKTFEGVIIHWTNFKY